MNLPETKKSLGQHWLTDPLTLQHICQEGNISEADHVLEIGPGSGTLTETLLATGAHVTAVEFDQTLEQALVRKFAGKKFQLVSGDILKFDFGQMPAGYIVVANIPYYLTSNLIRVLSETTNPASRVVLLVQKEVAERVAASAGKMSLLSVSAQFYWQISLGIVVPAKLFTPPPKVDSQVLIMTRRPMPLFPNVETKEFFRLVKAGFSSRRKTLLNSLSGGLRIDKPKIQEILEEAYIDPSLRAQSLELEQWHVLYMICRTQGIL